MEEKLRENERKLQTFFSAILDGLIITDMNGVIIDANEAAAHIGRYENIEDIIGRNGLDFVTEDDREKVAKALSSVLSDPKRKHSEVIEYIAQDKDGNPFYGESSAVVIRDGSGAAFGMIFVTRDITERKKAEEALRESEEKYRILYESSRDALMILEPPSWQFTSGNQAAVALFGARDEADFVSRGPWQYSPERQPDGRVSDEKSKEMIEKAIRKGSHFFEWIHRTLSGREFPASVLLTRMEINGQPLLQATVRDETEQNRAEEALKESEGRS